MTKPFLIKLMEVGFFNLVFQDKVFILSGKNTQSQQYNLFIKPSLCQNISLANFNDL